jgi:hypothetical protein
MNQTEATADHQTQTTPDSHQHTTTTDKWSSMLNRSLKLVGVLVGLTLAAFLSTLIYLTTSAGDTSGVTPGIGNQGLTCADGSAPDSDGVCADGSVPS